MNKDGVNTSLLLIKNSFPKDLYQDVEAMNNLGKQLKNYKIIKAYNVILGDYSLELRDLGCDKNNRDGGLRWFKKGKSYPTLDNFPHLDMSSIKEETTIFEETHLEKKDNKRGREDINESNYETSSAQQ